jgi:hypothetical protein
MFFLTNFEGYGISTTISLALSILEMGVETKRC